MRTGLATCTVAVTALLASAGGASAQSTLDRTVVATPGAGLWTMTAGPPEPHVVRSGPLGVGRGGRASRRRSLAYFGQLTDPQLVDEMSPARVEFVDPAGGAARAAHRPHETLGTQTFDQVVRAMNAAGRRSRVAQRRGRRARMGFALTTGDLADNQQLNETRWLKAILSGGRVDPFSGKAITAHNPCTGAGAEDVARMNADVAARRYTGVQDYADWPGRPEDRYAAFWDPDRPAPAGSPFGAWPRFPGLLDRAQRAFTAPGLDVPWFISRGNHDGLVQGTAPSSEDLIRLIATSCTKVYPSASFDPAQFVGAGDDEVFRRLADPAFLQALLAGAGLTPPDPARRFVGKAEFKRIIGHGFRRVDRTENRRSAGTASYYAFTRRGIRFIALDTVAEGGGSDGNLDHPQYRWLGRELRRAGRRGQLVIAFGHHPLATMGNARTDEQATACADAREPGCDRDPRRSTPMHLGLAGAETVRDLLLRHRNVVAYVAGHIHANLVTPYARGRHGFWEIATASHTDFPQQSRTIEVMDNRDGTLSLFGTMLDHAGDVAPPTPNTPAASLSDRQLASLARQLAASDPQPVSTSGGLDSRGRPEDRNVELIVRDPRR